MRRFFARREPMEWIQAAGSLTLIFGFAAGVFSYVVLKPLNKAIGALEKAVWEFRKELRSSEIRRNEMEKQLITIDNKANRAHERIDDLTRFCEMQHNKKV
jgi:hypothetical protein